MPILRPNREPRRVHRNRSRSIAATAAAKANPGAGAAKGERRKPILDNGQTAGFIGTDFMDATMAGHLLEAGYALRVHNRTRKKADRGKGRVLLRTRLTAPPSSALRRSGCPGARPPPNPLDGPARREYSVHGAGLRASGRLRPDVQAGPSRGVAVVVIGAGPPCAEGNESCKYFLSEYLGERRGGRVDECTGFENRRARQGTGGSNPPLSATSAASPRDGAGALAQKRQARAASARVPRVSRAMPGVDS